ncbi:MAG: tetratricopeptide repeat protein [Rhodobacterales bacterium]
MPLKQPKQSINSLADLRRSAIKAHQNNDLEQARARYRIYLKNNPEDAAMWSNLGALFRTQKNYDMAVAAQIRALELAPGAPTLMNNAANAFYDAGQIEKALKLREKIIALEPDNPDHYASLGKCYRGVHQLDKARNILNQGIEKFPDFAESHIQLAFVQLAMGHYPQGFKSFNWRWQGDELSPPDFTCPQWAGEPLKGKTLTIIPEQGFGDTVLMARFLPALNQQGATLKMAVKPPLRRLFSNIESFVEFVDTNPSRKNSDYWAPMMDLPLYLNATLATLPKPTSLFIPDDATKRARRITAPYQDRFKLGVMWSGSVTYRANHKRSFSHRCFLELCDIPGLQMFSLYKGPLLPEFDADGTSAIIVNAAASDRDFADTAALMRALDLVVTMDSAVAHIAGSLGIEVWNLLHSEAYWLYEPYPDHTPWYPSMRLVRQKKSGDWDGVFKILHTDITTRIADKAQT